MPLTLTPAAITVTPAPISIQPPAISVTDAQMVAALQADGYTVTAAPTPIPAPTPTPPATSAWAGVVVDNNGNLDPYWGGVPTPAGALGSGGNWNVNYTQQLAQASVDGGKAMELNSTGAYPIWLPYPAAFSTVLSADGIGVNLTPFTHFEADVIPTQAGLTLAMALYSVSGAFVAPYSPVNDKMIGSQIVVAQNLPVGVPTTISVALSTLGAFNSLNPVPGWIRKFGLQQNHAASGQNIQIRNARFV